MVSLSGTLAPGTTYYQTTLYLDRGQCPVIELTVAASGSGEGQGDPQYPPEEETPPQETPQTRACMTISAVHEVPGFLFFPATTTEIAATIVVNGDDERTTPFQLCATATAQFMLYAADFTHGPQQQEAPFSRWEKYNTYSESWATISETQQAYVALESGAAYRAVYREEPLITIVPRETQDVCLDISAVLMYQEIPTTTQVTTPQFSTEPIFPQILVDDQTRYAPFQLCDAPGTQFLLIAESEHWTGKEEHLEFWKWQRYNAESGTWIDILLFMFGDVEPGRLSVDLQSGGQLRAVYRRATRLY